MPTELPVDISGLRIFPDQRLEDKIGYVGKIDDVYEKGSSIPLGRIRVAIRSCNTSNGLLDLNQEDFEKFLSCYNLKTPRYLIGESVISVYTRSAGAKLCGLIPINLDKP